MDCKLRAKNCGGCPMLATEYAAQLKKKEADVRALLGKYGPVAPIRGMETPYHYRNKVISTFAPAAGGKLTSGIYAARTHKVLPVESCLLQDEVLDKVMLAVRAAANACRYQPFHEDKGTGLLRHCLLRRGVATGQVMVVLVTACGMLLLLAQVQVGMRQRHQELVVWRTLGAGKKLLRTTLWCEFAMLGFVSGLVAAIGAETALAVLQAKVFDFPWEPDWRLWIVLPCSGALLLSLFGGWLGARLVKGKALFRQFAG